MNAGFYGWRSGSDFGLILVMFGYGLYLHRTGGKIRGRWLKP